MKPFRFSSSSCVFVEISAGSFKAYTGEDGFDLALERLDVGRVTPACKERIVTSMTGFLNGRASGPRQHAFCALGARGISLRRLTLPRVPAEELQRLLKLQMENEFPLPPEALAWGYCCLNGRMDPTSASAPGQEVLVAALKREVVEDYAEVLARCGLKSTFTLAAAARASVCPPRPETYTLLEIGLSQSELVTVEHSEVTAVKMISWGGENLVEALEKQLGIPEKEAQKLLHDLEANSLDDDLRSQVQAAVFADLHSCAGLFEPRQPGGKLYVTGERADADPVLTAMSQALRVDCQRVQIQQGRGRSAATLGLERLWEKKSICPILDLHVREPTGSKVMPQPSRWRWAALAGVMLLAALSFRYAEPFLCQAGLSRRLSEIKSYREGLPRIDRELTFLQYLQEAQPPLLDALLVIANAAPGGTRLDAVSMNRRGDVSLRGMMANTDQTTDFRGKLIQSGFFTTVVLDEQTPTPDRQRVQFRLTAQWKPPGQRPRVSSEPK